ncbi:hypothetical protein NEHOM01_0597 [Nematocida homosporus]|uniref:uncharacterized protein n=1 Tax=Nematocida homosporus TaxID=1912981 RepID=UPI002220C68B|nr:uncharacterized protein NEHOM01_0597 [Nematocida homosporus]KAI5185092.1 hypothetical protein NEHOM01_0597 [Nematocida homosporus]
MKAPVQDIEMRIGVFIHERRILEVLPDLVREAKDNKTASLIVEQLSTKERRVYPYATIFITGYLEGLTEVPIRSYKHCLMINKDSPKMCDCLLVEKRDRLDDLAALQTFLRLMKKGPLDLVKSIIYRLTDLAIYSGIPSELISTLHLIYSLDLLDSSLGVKIIEFTHAFYVLGMEYEAFKSLEFLCQLDKVSPSTDRMCLMIMAQYFLQADNYRGYLNSIERLQSLHMAISPIPTLAEYAKYQKILTDYDKIIRYKPTQHKKGLVAGHAYVFSPDIPHELWEWYIGAIATQEELNETDSLAKITFLRKHRIQYRVQNGLLHIYPKNSYTSYIDYLVELEDEVVPTPPVAPLLSITDAPGTPDVPSEPATPNSGFTKREPRKRNPLRPIFEEKEYLLRLAIERAQRETVPVDSTPVEFFLDTVNRRFQQARERNLDTLVRVLASAPRVHELVEDLAKRLVPAAPETPSTVASSVASADLDTESESEATPASGSGWTNARDPITAHEAAAAVYTPPQRGWKNEREVGSASTTKAFSTFTTNSQSSGLYTPPASTSNLYTPPTSTSSTSNFYTPARSTTTESKWFRKPAEESLAQPDTPSTMHRPRVPKPETPSNTDSPTKLTWGRKDQN